MKISPSKEDYIKTIFNLNGSEEIVSNKSLANSLKVSAASVTDMNNRLVKENLISYFPYKGVQLTDLGAQVANQLIRKHRIWEVFLHEKLGFDWDEVHHEADRLEHASSNKLIERLNAFLNHPKYDPHGGLIPNADGSVSKDDTPLISLKEIEVNQYFIVREVSDEDDELLNYLTMKGFSLNDEYEMVGTDAYDGTISIRNIQTNDTFTISEKAVSEIKVNKIEEK